jgi:N utilization substance protein B
MASTRNSKPGEDVRSSARERAVHFLYEAESRSLPVSVIVAAQVLAVDDLVSTLTSGVASRQSQLDEMITEYSHTWTIHRMPAIDRNVLRLAIYELIDRPEVPTAVVINEAVELAKRFSTEESGRYVNGVLSAIAKQVRSKGF